MHIKQFEAEYTYDYDLDVINIEMRSHTGTDAMNDRIEFFVLFDLGNSCPFRIQNLASQRQNRLEGRITALLGTAAGRIALD